MTGHLNGWPERPGVPLNPERDGWHWVSRPMHGVLPMQWLEIAGGGWVGKHVCLFASEAANADWRYLGPCLLPAEVASLVEAARREAAAQEREDCVQWHYKQVDTAKGHAKKYPRNSMEWASFKCHEAEHKRSAAAIRARGGA